MARWPLGLVAALLGVALAGPASAQSPAEPRLALVIGNAAYKDAPLRNPVRDARAMATALRAVGFTVIVRENAPKRDMEGAILEFGRRLTGGGVGLFFYAGHGLQVRGRNYLVPVDAAIDSEAATRVEAVDIDLLLEQMNEAKNRVNFVILDACRNNPFERRMRGAARGLAAVDAARGTLIAYATAPGSVAADGDTGNGLYTEELIRGLTVPGLKAEEVFKRVRIGVTERSRGAQTPWESSSLTGDFVFNVTVNVAVTAPVTAPSAADREVVFWNSIKDGVDAGAFQAYLKQYPQGTFAELARLRLAALAPSTAKPPVRFDGAWVGAAHDTRGVKGCADNATLTVTISEGIARGTMRQPSGQVSTFNWALAADGTVTSPGVSGGFTEDAFRGRWQRTGSRDSCVFDVTLKRQGTR